MVFLYDSDIDGYSVNSSKDCSLNFLCKYFGHQLASWLTIFNLKIVSVTCLCHDVLRPLKFDHKISYNDVVVYIYEDTWKYQLVREITRISAEVRHQSSSLLFTLGRLGMWRKMSMCLASKSCLLFHICLRTAPYLA